MRWRGPGALWVHRLGCVADARGRPAAGRPAGAAGRAVRPYGTAGGNAGARRPGPRIVERRVRPDRHGTGTAERSDAPGARAPGPRLRGAVAPQCVSHSGSRPTGGSKKGRGTHWIGRSLQIVWAGGQVLGLLLKLPVLLFAGLVSLVRTILGLILLAGLGSCAYELYSASQAQVRTSPPGRWAGGEAWRDRARALDKALAGRDARVEQGRDEEDWRSEAATARRARARYEAEVQRMQQRARDER